MNSEDWLFWVMTTFGGLWLAVITWNWKQLVNRVDDKASKEETDRRFNEMLKRIDEHLSDDKELHRDMTSEMTKQGKLLAGISAKVGVLHVDE